MIFAKVINDFQKVSNHLKKKNILIDNCRPKSGKSQHFCFGPVINKLAASYPEINFFVLNPVADIKRKNNIFFVGEIFDGPTNLNEFSYLSLFCDIIIGRTSGPWMHTIVAENIQDENKTFICFCKKEIESSYINKSYLKANFLWKNTVDLEEIYQTIDSEIKKQPELHNIYLKRLAKETKILSGVDSSILAIENKTYGICRVTGKLIQKARLKLVPHATLSIEAKKAQD